MGSCQCTEGAEWLACRVTGWAFAQWCDTGMRKCVCPIIYRLCLRKGHLKHDHGTNTLKNHEGRRHKQTLYVLEFSQIIKEKYEFLLGETNDKGRKKKKKIHKNGH